MSVRVRHSDIQMMRTPAAKIKIITATHET